MKKSSKNDRKTCQKQVVAPATRNKLTTVSTTRDLPAAVSKLESSGFSIRQTSDGVEISGRDLVQTLPQSVAVGNQSYLFTAIPANPCYWKGTRVGALAAAYQCYRPIRLIFHYVPQVAVTTAGTVLVGTTWNTPFAPESLEQSMVTSNGGGMCQCYVAFDTEIRLGTNLPQNLFTCAGSLDEDHNPFFFIALMRGSNVVPGYFFVEYTYALKNALGQAMAYDTLLTTAPEYGAVRMDRSILALGTVPGFAGPGAVFDLESDGEAYYNGTLVSIPDGVPVIVFANTPMSVVDPTFSSEVQSIVVLPRAADVGSSVILQPDRATWNWQTDGNFATGTFGVSGASPVSFQSTLNTISFWIENAAAATRLFVYALDLATNTIGPLIALSRAVNGSMTDPTLTLRISPRQVPTTRRRALQPRGTLTHALRPDVSEGSTSRY